MVRLLLREADPVVMDVDRLKNFWVVQDVSIPMRHGAAGKCG